MKLSEANELQGGAAVPFNASSAICDRADSRTAVHVIEHVLRPRIVAAGYTVPEGCLLDAARDMFALQEAHKKLVRKSVWRCKFDDKVFRGEGYIDSHMDKAHGNETHPGARACMADLCDYLHCDFFKAAKKGSTQSLRSAQCHPGTMQERKARCQDVAHACFPPHAGGTAEVLHGFMLSTLCEAATCRWQLREELLGPLAKNPHAEAYMRTVRLLVVAFVCVAIYFAVLVQWSSRNKARELDLMGRARALWTGQKRGGRKLH